MPRINCHRCTYYFVTWEKNRPHGCKAYGFKSQYIPSILVKQSSGTECTYYTPKPRPSDGQHDILN